MKLRILVIGFIITFCWSNISGQSVDSLILKAIEISESQPDSALIICDNVLELEPYNLDIFMLKVNIYLMLDKIDKVFEAFDQQILNDSTNANIYFARGCLYYKEFPEDTICLKDYKKAIDINPNYFDALYNLGAVYNNKAFALSDSTKQTDDSNNILIKYYYEQAVIYTERAYKLEPTDKYVKEMLLHIYTELNLTDKKEKLELEINKH